MSGMDSPIEAVKALSRSLKTLRAQGVIRSRSFIGDLGEWYVEQLYEAEMSTNRVQKGWDLLVPVSGERLQVKTQSYSSSPTNQWNYLGSDPTQFDRLIVIMLTEDLIVRDLYDVPAFELSSVLQIGKEQKPYYMWSKLAPWRVELRTLPGYAKVAELVTS